MDLKSTKGLWLIEGGIKVFEDIALNKQRVAKTRQGIMRLLACCEEILKEKKKKKKSVSLQALLLISASNLQGMGHCHLYCWTLEMMILIPTLSILRLHLWENPF